MTTPTSSSPSQLPRGYLATGIGRIFVKYPVDVVVAFILRLRQLEEEEDAKAEDDEDEDDE